MPTITTRWGGACIVHAVPVDQQVASHWGGTRNGTIVHWPAGLADKGTARNQFHHVIDVAPTILGPLAFAPLYVNGIPAGAAGG